MEGALYGVSTEYFTEYSYCVLARYNGWMDGRLKLGPQGDRAFSETSVDKRGRGTGSCEADRLGTYIQKVSDQEATAPSKPSTQPWCNKSAVFTTSFTATNFDCYWRLPTPSTCDVLRRTSRAT